MWKTMSFELDAEAQGRYDCGMKPGAKPRLRRPSRRQGKRVTIAAWRRVGVAHEAHRCILQLPQLVCVQKAPESLAALCTPTTRSRSGANNGPTARAALRPHAQQ